MKPTESEMLRLINELEIQKIELKAQNDELLMAKSDAQFAITRYTELYDFAPSGYVTLSPESVMVNLNLAFAKMLGKDRKQLINCNLDSFVSEDSRLEFQSFLTKVFESTGKTTCGILLSGSGQSPLYVQLDGVKSSIQGECLITISDISRRRHAEIALQESEEKHRQDLLLLKSIFESPVSIIIFSLDTNYCYTGFTQSHKETIKHIWGAEIRIGMNMLDLIANPEDRLKAKNNFDRAINGEFFIITEEFGDKLLNRTFFEDYYSCVKDFNGNIVGVSVFVIDVTQRMQAQLNLERGEKRFREVVEQSMEVVWEVDDSGLYTYVSPISLNVYGYSSDQLVGKMHFYDLNPVENRQHIRDQALGVFSRKESFKNFINTIVKPDGTLVTLSTNGIPLFDESGNLIGYRGIDADITEQKIAEQQIKEFTNDLERGIEKRTAQLSEINHVLQLEIGERNKVSSALEESLERLNKIASRLPGFIYQFRLRLDGTSCFPFASEGMKSIYQVSPEEVTTDAAPFFKRLHPDDFKQVVDSIQESAASLTIWSHEYRVRYMDGNVRWLSGNAVPQREPDGSVLWHGFISDITRQRQAQEFENELLELSLQMTGIPGSQIAAALDLSLRRIGSFLGADRAYIFELNPADNTMSNTHEWCEDRIQPEIGNLQNVPCDAFPNWMKALSRFENVIIPVVHDLPDTWQAEREFLELQAIKSVIAMPILNENKLIGFVGLDSVSAIRDYDISELNILKVWGNLLASLINKQKIENILDQTRFNYETFFNTIDDFLFVLDVQGNIIHINNTVEQRLGYTYEELSGQSVLLVHPPERRAEAGRIVGEMLVGTADFCPVPLITKSAAYIPVETRVKPGKWNGKPVIFGVSKDVSKIKLSEEKFSKAFQSSAALMAISSLKDGVFMDINETFINKLGYSRNEIVGQSSRTLELFVDKAMRKWIVEQATAGVPVRDIEVEVLKKDGSTIIGLFSADIIHFGVEKCLLTMMVDITERKQAEEEVMRARNEAEKANQAKSEFLSRMSHELRTPMNSILGFAQLLEMGELTSGHRKAVKHILNSGKHLLDLINEVLDISRIEAGKMMLSLEPVQLAGIIHEMMEVVQFHAQNRQLTLQLIQSPSNQLFVKADNQRLKQVLLNLLNNAIKYNRVGGYVTLKTEPQPNGDSGIPMVRISVTDTGIGISSNDIPKLFMPFERIGAEKSETEGTGLGLAVIKKLMDAMGGTIGVESIPGTGSIFWIELPVSGDPRTFKEQNADEILPATNLYENRGTVLYIEDNISNIELIDNILSTQRPGIHLIAHTDGKNAVNQAIEYKPDLILLDLDLPFVHGQEVLANLQSNVLTKSIPVVIISADAIPQQVDKLIGAGARNYLTKPLDIVVFLHMLDEWISR
jgi:PAS domain S-box-containing protein